MSYQVLIPRPAQKQLNNLPKDVGDRMVEKILLLAEDPRPAGTKKLKGYDNEYRIRVGNYRVRYEVDDEQSIVTVLSCRHRKDVVRIQVFLAGMSAHCEIDCAID